MPSSKAQSADILADTGAGSESRTRTPLRASAPKADVSTVPPSRRLHIVERHADDVPTPSVEELSAQMLDAVERYMNDPRGYQAAQRRQREVYRRYGRPRRERQAGLSPKAMTLEQLGERDGWVCAWSRTKQCRAKRKRIDPRLSGNDPLGPTVEHIVPISQGGTNDADNLAVAHRMCNVGHNVRGTVQMRLLP